MSAVAKRGSRFGTAEDVKKLVEETVGPEAVQMVGAEIEGQYEDYPDWDDTFVAALQACIHQLPFDFSFDPKMTDEKSDANRDTLGVIEARFGGQSDDLWHVKVNYSTKKQGRLPAGYASISYKDTEVGIIGPWLTIRTCWQCGLSGSVHPKRPHLGKCRPGEPCPRCRGRDWWGIIVTPEMLEEAAAESVANSSKVGPQEQDRIYRRLTEKY